MRINISYILSILILCSCSTTKLIKEGEQLYTGIEEIEFIGKKEYASSPIGELAITEVEAALAAAPNGSIAGSSTIKGAPVGLWWYNAFADSKSRIGKWFFKHFASNPILISDVNPKLRALVAKNALTYYGYFNGDVTSEIITNKKNPKKAKIRYRVTLHEPYKLANITYTGFSTTADSLIQASMDKSLLKDGEQFNVNNLTGERERINSLLRDNGFYYSQTGYINFLADSINTPGHIELRIKPKGLSQQVKQPYKIGNIEFQILNNSNGLPKDSVKTLKLRNFSITYTGEKPPVRPGTMMRNIFLRSGKTYSQELQQLSLQQLSQMNIFSSINFAFIPRENSNILDTRISTQLDKPNNFTF